MNKLAVRTSETSIFSTIIEKEDHFLTQSEKLKILDNAIHGLAIDESQQFDNALVIHSYDLLSMSKFPTTLSIALDLTADDHSSFSQSDV